MDQRTKAVLVNLAILVGLGIKLFQGARLLPVLITGVLCVTAANLLLQLLNRPRKPTPGD